MRKGMNEDVAIAMLEQMIETPRSRRCSICSLPLDTPERVERHSNKHGRMDSQMNSKNFPAQRSFSRSLFKKVINANPKSSLFGETRFIRANEKAPTNYVGIEGAAGQQAYSVAHTKVRHAF